MALYLKATAVAVAAAARTATAFPRRNGRVEMDVKAELTGCIMGRVMNGC